MLPLKIITEKKKFKEHTKNFKTVIVMIYDNIAIDLSIMCFHYILQ